MDPDADPMTDRQEFADRLEMYVKRCQHRYRDEISRALLEANVVDQKRYLEKIKAYQNWRDDCLEEWDAADEAGRKKLVGGLVVNEDEIVKNFKPLI